MTSNRVSTLTVAEAQPLRQTSLRGVPISAIVLVIAALICLCVVVWSRTLGCYFYVDDFLQLPYLYQVFHGHPDWLLKNFYGAWIENQAQYLFYRPVTELTLALDYLISAGEPWAYHLSSVCYHTVAVIAAFFLSMELLHRFPKKQALTMSFLAAALFGISPLHAEAVAWAAARADLAYGASYVFSLAFLIRARRTGSSIIAFAGCALFVISLLCKELAISLPAVVLLYALVVEERKQDLFAVIRSTAGLWMLSAIYLVARTLALGVFVGGYTGSLGDAMNQSIWQRWITEEPFEYVLYPVSSMFFCENHPLRHALRILYVFSAVAIVLKPWNSHKLRLCSWLALWSFIVLALNYQIFHLCPTLAGSRILYLSLCPLAIFLVAAVSPLMLATGKVSRIFWCISVPLLSAFVLALVLSTNVSVTAWLKAGDEVRAVRTQLEQQLISTPDSVKLVLFDLPAMSNGCISILYPSNIGGLMRPPLCSRDWTNRLVAPESQLYSSQVLRPNQTRELCSRKNSLPLRWKSKTRSFVGIEPFSATQGDNRSDLDIQCKGNFSYVSNWPPVNPKPVYGNAKLGANIKSFTLTPAKPVSPLLYDYLGLDVVCTPRNDDHAKSVGTMDVTWNTIEDPTWYFVDRVRCKIKPDSSVHTYTIPISEQNRWLINGEVSAFRIDIPTCYDSTLVSAFLTSGYRMVPRLSLPENQDVLIDGSLQVSDVPVQLPYDASRILGCVRVKVELSKPGFAFEMHSGSYRSSVPARYIAKTWLLPKSGVLSVTRALVQNTPGVYYVRLVALSQSNEEIGEFSDPIGLSVSADLEEVNK